MNRVLITGGAGFIGSHLCELLLRRGYAVRVVDSFSEQVHGLEDYWPTELKNSVEFLRGDVRDAAVVNRAVKGTDAVVHLAAAVGVGQSMYRIADYVSTNDLGTAVLWEALAAHPVKRVVVASSMSVYGEGLARTAEGRLIEPRERDIADLKLGRWEPRGAGDMPLEPVPTPETKQPALTSVYALNKFTQERLCLIVGRAYGVPTVALRFFNVFGPRQALSNPYTGVLAIFAARLLNGRPPLIFEDGRQRRDFVHVRDVARACLSAIESSEVDSQVYNIGSGQSRTVLDVARSLGQALGRPDLTPQVTGRYRAGDIRHCFADISRARADLRFEPAEPFEAGIAELAEWIADKTPVDMVERATDELASRGLVA